MGTSASFKPRPRVSNPSPGPPQCSEVSTQGTSVSLPAPGGPAPEQLGRVGWPALFQQHEHSSRALRAGLYAVPS